MKIIRSSQCSLKFSTAHKKAQLQNVLSEYGKVVNIFIEHFWYVCNIFKTHFLLRPEYGKTLEKMVLDKHEKRFKRYKALERELNELYAIERNLGYKELEKPIFLGWKVKLIPRKDIQNRDDANVFWEVIKTCCSPGFIPDKSYLKKKNSKFNKKPYVPEIIRIYEKQYEALSDAAKKFFSYSEYHSTCWHKIYYYNGPNFYWEHKLVRVFKTHIRVIDGDLKSRIKEVRDEYYELGRENFWSFHGTKTVIARKMNRAARHKTKQLLKQFVETGELTDDFPISGRHQAYWEAF